MMDFSKLLLFLPLLVTYLTLGNICDDTVSLSRKYLNELRAGEIEAFIPTVYFEGSSSKYVSTTDQTEIDHPYLCVDGASSYEGPIELFDNGSKGDDFANDGVYSRGCVHYCTSQIDYSDFFGYVMHFKINGLSGLAVMDPTVKGTIPYKTINIPLTPGATVIASSHAFFFADVNGDYYPNYHSTLAPNNNNPMSGKNPALSALLQIFGDVFDFVTTTPMEDTLAFDGWVRSV